MKLPDQTTMVEQISCYNKTVYRKDVCYSQQLLNINKTKELMFDFCKNLILWVTSCILSFHVI